MPTPIETSLPWAVLRPRTTGAPTLTVEAYAGVTLLGARIALPIGVNTLMASWSGSSAVSIQVRNPANTAYRLVTIPAGTRGVTRTVVVDLPVEAEGHGFTVIGISTPQEDVDSSRMGVKIIPSNM